MSKKIVTTSQITVGLDIGYGATKVIAPEHDPIIFPSVCGEAHNQSFQMADLAAKYPGDQITDEDGDWFIGDLAESQITQDGALLRLRGLTADEDSIGNVFRVRMARAAIGKLLPGIVNGDAVHVRIATGLPVSHMKYAQQLKAALIGEHPIRTDQANFVAHVSEVFVMPQPVGTIYSRRLTDTGTVNVCDVALRVGVVDVGTYTIDLALDDDGEFVNDESASVEAGTHTAQEAIKQLLFDQYGEVIPLGVVDTVLRTGCFRAKGNSQDWTRQVEAALKPLRRATLNLMGATWHSGVRLDAIYLTGGGATLVEKAVSAHYPQAVAVENAQLANARGYLNFALFRAKS
jgi:plasmid segregation protein ParM